MATSDYNRRDWDGMGLPLRWQLLISNLTHSVFEIANRKSQIGNWNPGNSPVLAVTSRGDQCFLMPVPFGGSIGASQVFIRNKQSVRSGMPQNYVPIFIFVAIVGIALPLTLVVAKLVRPENPSRAKLMPYECGIDPVDNARGRYTVRFYIVAILFVVFDVETIFLFPWAVQFKALGKFGLLEMFIFLGILIVGYVWVWKKGALEWI
jgi:NADH-quinone oxidoreductase subunit A